MARPWLKSAGGKSKLVPQILELLPKNPTAYYEPFVGGGAVFYAIKKLYPNIKAVLNDANLALTITYRAVRDNVDNIIDIMKFSHRFTNEEQIYYQMRELFDPELEDEIQLACMFIYLNKTGFNGLWRVNQDGKFNVPFGRYDNPTICDEDNLRACSKILQGVSITCADFQTSIMPQDDLKGSMIYIDPPYVPANKVANFTAYTAGGFSAEDHVRLRNSAWEWRKRGAFVLVSNSDTPLVRSMYPKSDWTLVEVEMARAINSKGNKRGKVPELLIY